MDAWELLDRIEREAGGEDVLIDLGALIDAVGQGSEADALRDQYNPCKVMGPVDG